MVQLVSALNTNRCPHHCPIFINEEQQQLTHWSVKLCMLELEAEFSTGLWTQAQSAMLGTSLEWWSACDLTGHSGGFQSAVSLCGRCTVNHISGLSQSQNWSCCFENILKNWEILFRCEQNSKKSLKLKSKRLPWYWNLKAIYDFVSFSTHIYVQFYNLINILLLQVSDPTAWYATSFILYSMPWTSFHLNVQG